MVRLLTALLVFAAGAVGTALLLTVPAHRGLDPDLALAALAAGAAAAAAAFLQMTRSRPAEPAPPLARPISPCTWLAFTAFGLFALRAFCWLIFNRGDRIEILSPNNLGDLSLHMQLARYFANGVPWWPGHPEDAREALRYYPGIDLFQSLLLLRGADEIHALIWVGLAGFAATAAALYRWGGAFTVAGFLFSGGLAGFRFFAHARMQDYQADLAWKSLPLALFVTQRGFLFALPAGLLLLAHWRAKFFAGRRPEPGVSGTAGPPGLVPFWVEWLLYAIMPAFHVFCFVFLSLLLGWWFIAYFPNARLRTHLLGLVALAAAPASCLIYLMTSGFSGSTVWIEWGWMGHGQPFLAFWLLNFGLFAPLAAGVWVHCAWTCAAAGFGGQVRSLTPPAAEAFVLPAGVLFVAACIVMLTPWDWDNTKIMIWCYLAALPFLWERCLAKLDTPWQCAACALLFFSGFVSVAGGIGPRHTGYELANRDEVDDVRSATRSLPAAAVFAAAPAYNHPLVFCGRRMAMGYEGHLFSEGLDYRQLAADLRTLMLGQPGWEAAARRLDARYLYWGPREEKAFAGSGRPWEHGREPVAAGSWGRLYDLGP